MRNQERISGDLQHSRNDDQDLRKTHDRKPSTWLLTIGLAYSSLGVIYGDIGTSPLYTVSSIFVTADSIDKEDVIAGISMIFWTITLVVLCKYILVVLHANDKGEGGTFALFTLLCRTFGISPMGTMQKAEHSQLLTISDCPDMIRTAMQPRKGVFTTSLARYSRQPWSESAATASMSSRWHKPASVDSAIKDLKWWNKWHLPNEAVIRWFRETNYAQRILLCVAIVGTSMVFGDGVLTPAVSVVSAVSGLKVGVESITTNVVVGVSCVVLVVLFAFQFKGTASVAMIFSPIVALWLVANAAIGIYNLAEHGPEILQAFSPHYIIRFFQTFGGEGWRMLGSVMLSVTGAEAMFADLGHFDIPSVVISFVGFVYPCLLLTYFGQGAYLITHLENVGTTYWSAIPSPVFWPMLVLATLASVVASQALITACYSICKQAEALGFFPKVKIVHTSLEAHGHIYISSVNWILLVLTIAVVAGFNADSTKLGQAYGLTISVVMFITTVLTTLTMITAWRVSFPLVFIFASLFVLIDGAFLSANLTKVPIGGWVAIAISMGVATVLFVWWAGQHKRMSMNRSSLRLQDVFTLTKSGASLSLPHQHTRIATAPDTPQAADKEIAPTDDLAIHQRAGPMGEGTDWYDPCSISGGISDKVAGPVAEGGMSPRLMEQGAQNRKMTDDSGLLSGASFTINGKPDPSQNELRLLRGELRLALNTTALTVNPLGILPGIALFYSDNADMVPLVLCHFMRNVEAIHEVNIIVTVRFLPIPSIAVADRLMVRSVPELPSFYQSVVRYGYLDTVDHGADFVHTLVTAVVHLLQRRSGLEHTTDINIDGAHQDATVDTRPGPVAEGLMDRAMSSQSYNSPILGAHRTVQASAIAQNEEMLEIRVLHSASTPMPNAYSGPSMQMFQSPRLSVNMTHLSRILTATSLGHVLSRSGLPTSLEAKVPFGCDQLMAMARAIENGEGVYPLDLEDAARRVAILVKAAGAGVVYFFGRTSLRMIPGSSLAHNILFETFYKPMLLLSYAQNESWNVPVDNLVELGMVVHI